MSQQAPVRAGTRPWRLRTRLGRVFLGLAVLLVALTTVVVVSAVKFTVAGNDVIYRWQPAASASQRVLADLVNQETGVRGYVLTAQVQALQPYTQYVAAQAADTARVADLAGSDPRIMDRLHELQREADVWHSRIARPLIAQVRQGKHPAASAVDAGKTIFDAIRVRAAALTAALAAKTETARSARTLDGWFAGVSLAIALVLIVGAGIALWRGLHRWVLGPVDRLGGQTRDVASGERSREIVPEGPIEFTELGRDVEGMRAQIVAQLARAEEDAEELRRKGEELERSNADLQQFAYVASHDLSEPLRKVANFCQLLERQYGPQLDDRARQYIDFAVDGAKRMQALIADLLALSRVGRTTESFAPVDTSAVLDQVLWTLAERIADAGARVDRPDLLPTISGDRSLIASLLENLVGNAVKYRRADTAPVVTVSVEPAARSGMWTFTISDNGIGIDPQYAERIFAVFQRLHLRDEYGGTGIGLALCRKIVEFHGGQIWLDPVQSRPGATFMFTLPEGGIGAEPTS